MSQTEKCPFDTNDRAIFKLLKFEWRAQGKDRVCNYCGAWHPDEFMAFCDEILEGKRAPTYPVKGMESHFPGGLPVLEVNDERDKIYVHRDHVKNAGDGAIKIYTAHLTEEQLKRANEAIRVCVQAARTPRVKT